ncbi:hypothetical protein [Bacteroides neonati]|nr:hypothetical protein [Bacteroides neonati]
MIYITLISAALLLTYLVRFTVKEIKQHITKEADRVIKEINKQ